MRARQSLMYARKMIGEGDLIRFKECRIKSIVEEFDSLKQLEVNWLQRTKNRHTYDIQYHSKICT